VNDLLKEIREHVNNVAGNETKTVLFTSLPEARENDKKLLIASGLDAVVNYELGPIERNGRVCKLGDNVAECYHEILSDVLLFHTLNPNIWPLWELGNPFLNRVATRAKSRNHAELMTMMQLLLPGTNLLYYGEEIGMQNLDNETQPFPQRGAMLWDDTANAGFSKVDKPQAAISGDYSTINWMSQYNAPNSQWKMVQKLVKLRQRSEALNQGQVYIGKLYNHSAFTISRFLVENNSTSGKIYLGAVNFGKATVDLPLNDVPSINEADLSNTKVEAVNSGAQNYEPRTAIDLSSQTLQLGPEEGVVVSFKVL